MFYVLAENKTEFVNEKGGKSVRKSTVVIDLKEYGNNRLRCINMAQQLCRENNLSFIDIYKFQN